MYLFPLPQQVFDACNLVRIFTDPGSKFSLWMRHRGDKIYSVSELSFPVPKGFRSEFQIFLTELARYVNIPYVFPGKVGKSSYQKRVYYCMDASRISYTPTSNNFIVGSLCLPLEFSYLDEKQTEHLLDYVRRLVEAILQGRFYCLAYLDGPFPSLDLKFSVIGFYPTEGEAISLI